MPARTQPQRNRNETAMNRNQTKPKNFSQTQLKPLSKIKQQTHEKRKDNQTAMKPKPIQNWNRNQTETEAGIKQKPTATQS